MYALTLVENIFFLFFFKCTFSIMMDSGNYLRMAYAANHVNVGKWTFSMAFIHVDFYE